MEKLQRPGYNSPVTREQPNHRWEGLLNQAIPCLLFRNWF